MPQSTACFQPTQAALAPRPAQAPRLRLNASRKSAGQRRAGQLVRAFAPSRTSDGASMLPDELAAVRPPAIPMNETILLEGEMRA